jgi:hypothetical protein
MQKIIGFENAKTSKGTAHGYLTGIVYLAPYNLSGVNLCPKASKGCAAACLYTAGRGAFKSIQAARMAKTQWFLNDRAGFVDQLKREIKAAQKRAAKLGLKLAIRLNGTSDIVWERITDVIQSFPDVQFYDYTKIAKRFLWDRPANYDLTFSLSEDNETDAAFVLARGGRVAAVFRDRNFPASFLGVPVVSGDDHDLRFLDASGVVVGLYAKGKARKDASGFVRDTETAKGCDGLKAAA